MMNKEEIGKAFQEIFDLYGLSYFRNAQGVNNSLCDLIPGDKFKFERRILKRLSEYRIYDLLLDAIRNDSKGKKYIKKQCYDILITEDGMQSEVAEECLNVLCDFFWRDEIKNELENNIVSFDVQKRRKKVSKTEQQIESIKDAIILSFEHKQTDTPNTELKHYIEAAKNGDAQAQYNLGLIYDNGQMGVSVDHIEALKWYTNAAKQGMAKAQYQVGSCYYYGTGVKQDFKEAWDWYKRAANLNEARAQCMVGVFLSLGKYGIEKDDNEAIKWYIKSAFGGDRTGQFNLGFFYETGRGGVDKDDVEAVKWYLKAAEQELIDAQYKMGVFYQKGRGGVERDDIKAVKWFRKAADQGDCLSQFEIGHYYEFGQGGLDKSEKEAAKWYRKAANQGDSSSMYNLGRLLWNGTDEIEKDEPEAVRLFTTAAEAGIGLAQRALAISYARNKGVERDIDKALYWMKKAADNGISDAKEKYLTLEEYKKEAVNVGNDGHVEYLIDFDEYINLPPKNRNITGVSSEHINTKEDSEKENVENEMPKVKNSTKTMFDGIEYQNKLQDFFDNIVIRSNRYYRVLKNREVNIRSYRNIEKFASIEKNEIILLMLDTSMIMQNAGVVFTDKRIYSSYFSDKNGIAYSDIRHVIPCRDGSIDIYIKGKPEHVDFKNTKDAVYNVLKRICEVFQKQRY